LGDIIVYQKSAPELFTGLTFTANAPSTISFSNGNRNLEYQINGG